MSKELWGWTVTRFQGNEIHSSTTRFYFLQRIQEEIQVLIIFCHNMFKSKNIIYQIRVFKWSRNFKTSLKNMQTCHDIIDSMPLHLFHSSSNPTSLINIPLGLCFCECACILFCFSVVLFFKFYTLVKPCSICPSVTYFT